MLHLTFCNMSHHGRCAGACTFWLLPLLLVLLPVVLVVVVATILQPNTSRAVELLPLSGGFPAALQLLLLPLLEGLLAAHPPLLLQPSLMLDSAVLLPLSSCVVPAYMQGPLPAAAAVCPEADPPSCTSSACAAAAAAAAALPAAASNTCSCQGHIPHSSACSR
jgi:hypothetical protein